MPSDPRTEPGLREAALAALCQPAPQIKVQAAHALWQRLWTLPDEGAREQALAPARPVSPPQDAVLPGRPPRPVLVPPMDVPQRSPFTPEGLAALLHAVCHIEFNAIDLALDAVWRFPDMPPEFYRDWLRVADEEATHFSMLREHLQSLGHDYGDFPAHNGLWEMCVKTQHDITARMALVPRTLEARGLDATPPMQAKLARAGDRRAVEILEIILRDEVGHVAVGNHWYRWLCTQQGLNPEQHFALLMQRHAAPRPRPPFNEAARRAAGFSDAEIAALAAGTEPAHARPA